MNRFPIFAPAAVAAFGAAALAAATAASALSLGSVRVVVGLPKQGPILQRPSGQPAGTGTKGGTGITGAPFGFGGGVGSGSPSPPTPGGIGATRNVPKD